MRGSRVESESEREIMVLFEPVFDGDATCFVGISTWRSMLSERKRGREVLVTGGTRMCTRCGAGKLAWGVGGLTRERERGREERWVVG